MSLARFANFIKGGSAVLLLALAASSPSALFAQITNATLTGTIKDATGAVVPHAKIETTNRGTASLRSAVSDSNGQYVLSRPFRRTLPGQSFISGVQGLGASRFRVASRSDGHCGRGSRRRLHRSGSHGERIGAVVERGDVVGRPGGKHLNGGAHAAQREEFLAVGPVDAGGHPRARGSEFALQRQRDSGAIGERHNQWHEPDLHRLVSRRRGYYRNAVGRHAGAAERGRHPGVQIEGANMAAEYGHTPTMINASLKNGTNSLHGGVFEFLRNDIFDARNFFYIPPPGSTLTNEPLRRNQYGFTLGGPIRRDRTFFFADVERTSLRQGLDFNNVVPSLPMRSGDFSELLAGNRPVLVTDPLTRAAFPNNQIPGSRLSRQGLFFLKYLPEPNIRQGTTSRAALTNNIAIDTTRADLRIDHQISSSDQLMGRYSISDNTESDPNPFPALGRPGLHSRAQSVVLSETHFLSPKWINNARVSYYRSIFLIRARSRRQQRQPASGYSGPRRPVVHRQLSLHQYCGIHRIQRFP